MDVADIVMGGLGLLVVLVFVVWLVRHAFVGEPERVAEEQAREFYDRHGRWPDEP